MSDWISIKKKLPPYGRFLAYIPLPEEPIRIFERECREDDEYDAMKHEWNIGTSDDPFMVTLKKSQITHWMPLPEQPNER